MFCQYKNIYFKPITVKETFKYGRTIVGIVLKSNSKKYIVGQKYEYDFLARDCKEVVDIEIIHQLNKLVIFK